APARPEEGDELAGRDLEGEVGHRGGLAEAAGEAFELEYRSGPGCGHTVVTASGAPRPLARRIDADSAERQTPGPRAAESISRVRNVTALRGRPILSVLLARVYSRPNPSSTWPIRAAAGPSRVVRGRADGGRRGPTRGASPRGDRRARGGGNARERRG